MVRRTPAGIELVSREPLAGIGAGPVLPPGAFWLFAARAAMPDDPTCESSNNLKQIALALLSYEAAHRTFPPAYIADKATGKPLLSSRVAILPYLDQDRFSRSFISMSRGTASITRSSLPPCRRSTT